MQDKIEQLTIERNMFKSLAKLGGEIKKENTEHKETILFLGKENNKLKAQLARLDDIDGLAQFILSTTGSTSKLEDLFIFEQNLYIKNAQAVINYIKGD